MERIKICYTASDGGHTHELMQLNGLFQKYPGILITESRNVKYEFDAVYTLPLVNRKSLRFLFRFIQSFFTIRRILSKEKPTHIISFGAMCTVPVCIIGKLMKIKVIYVESYTRLKDLSLSGKIIYPFADLFVVQWKQLVSKYPKAVYGGALF
ncbi:MAG: polysaccharide biosynthesis protein [Oscillospiraceae bacterium]|nr:polysaccharide biosynthesis protein [Oscillospiraceae bacterium]